MGFIIGTSVTVVGEEEKLNKLHEFLNGLKDQYEHVDFDKIFETVPIYNSDLPTSGIRANLEQIKLVTTDDDTKILQFEICGWKGNYLLYIKQLLCDAGLGFYDKDNDSRSVFTYYYRSIWETYDHIHTNDVDGIYYPGQYLVVDNEEVCDSGYENYFDSYDEIVIWFKENLLEEYGDISEMDDLDDILHHLENQGIDITIAEVEIDDEDNDW